MPRKGPFEEYGGIRHTLEYGGIIWNQPGTLLPPSLRDGRLRHQQLRQGRQQLRFRHAARPPPRPTRHPPGWGGRTAGETPVEAAQKVSHGRVK